MTQEDAIAGLEEIFEVEPGTLKPDTPLDSLAWDSMAMLSVIALLSEKFGKRVTGAQVKGFQTIGDILAAETPIVEQEKQHHSLYQS